MFKKIINTQEKKQLFSNFLSLSTLQIANYILPLITLPYLVRVLGVEYFGLLAFATATVAYFGIIVDYGFNLTATREISIHRDDKAKVTEIYSAVMMIKGVLIIVSFVLLTIVIFSFDKFAQDATLYYLTFLFVIGQALYPIWFFQGMERMKYITYLNILSKTIFTILIFVFVHEKSDYLWVPVLTALGALIAGIWAIALIKKQFDITFQLQSFETIKFYLADGWHVFISNLAISLYTTSTTFILGIFTNNTIVGYFAAAEQVHVIISKLRDPVVNTFFPFINKKAKYTQVGALKTSFTLAKYMFYLYLFFGVIVFFFAKEIILLLFGEEYLPSLLILQIISFLPLLSTMSNIYGTQILLTFGYKKLFLKIYLFSMFFNLALALYLVPIFQQIGSAITIVVVEFIVTISMLYFALKLKKEYCVIQ